MNYFHGSEKKLHKMQTSQKHFCLRIIANVSLPGSTTVPSIYVKHGGCMVTNGTGTQMFIDKTVTEV